MNPSPLPLSLCTVMFIYVASVHRRQNVIDVGSDSTLFRLEVGVHMLCAKRQLPFVQLLRVKGVWRAAVMRPVVLQVEPLRSLRGHALIIASSRVECLLMPSNLCGAKIRSGWPFGHAFAFMCVRFAVCTAAQTAQRQPFSCHTCRIIARSYVLAGTGYSRAVASGLAAEARIVCALLFPFSKSLLPRGLMEIEEKKKSNVM